jgi:hypothetical protein
MTNRLINNKTNDNKRSYAQKEVWKPFKCHFNNCSNHFLTLDVMRDHLKEHKTQNSINDYLIRIKLISNHFRESLIRTKSHKNFISHTNSSIV